MRTLTKINIDEGISTSIYILILEMFAHQNVGIIEHKGLKTLIKSFIYIELKIMVILVEVEEQLKPMKLKLKLNFAI